MDTYKRVNDLARKIANGYITTEEAVNELSIIETQGKDDFLIWNVEKKEKPWNEDYLITLKDEVISGAVSKEQLMFMMEVADYVYRGNIFLRVKNTIKRLVYRIKLMSVGKQFGIGIAICVIVGAIWAAINFLKK